MTRVAAVILAAGRGRRLGRGPKAWVRVGGEALVARAARVLAEAGIARRVAVLPAGPDPEPAPPGVAVVRNPDPASGPLGSVLRALPALAGAEVLVLYPVDHAEVTVADVRAVLAGAADAPPGAARVVPTWGGRPGHPVAVLAAGIAALRGADAGAQTLRDVLRAAGPSLRVPAATPGVLRNANRPGDLPDG